MDHHNRILKSVASEDSVVGSSLENGQIIASIINGKCR